MRRVRPGRGRALDLGGDRGQRRAGLEGRGYTYVNLDIKPGGERKVQGDCHRLPFADGAFSLVVCNEAFDSLADHPMALREVRRVLEPGGTFVFWSPFLHQFGGDDLYRFTPRGLEVALDRAGFGIVSLEAPEWLVGLLATVPLVALKRLGLVALGRTLARVGERLDRLVRPDATRGLALARAYVVVARADGRQPSATAGEGLRPFGGRRGEGPGPVPPGATPSMRERLLLRWISPGTGPALEIGSGPELEGPLRRRGYSVLTVDGDGEGGRLPFGSATISLVLGSRGLGRSPDPFELARDIRRVLRADGLLVAWAPHLDSWRPGEYIRFTPLGLALLLRWAGFRVVSFEVPAWLFSAIAQMCIVGLRIPERGPVAGWLERIAFRLDSTVMPSRRRGYGFAAAYLVVARPDERLPAIELSEASWARTAQLWDSLGDRERATKYRLLGRYPPATDGSG